MIFDEHALATEAIHFRHIDGPGLPFVNHFGDVLPVDIMV